jgi:hypothetical protein
VLHAGYGNGESTEPDYAFSMRKPKLIAAVLGGILASVALFAILWWHNSVDQHIGYCKTPTDTCINRENAALGEPCECLGMGGGVFGLDSTGVVVPKDAK